MSKNEVLKAFYFWATVPAKLISSLLLFFNMFQIRCKLDKCINVVDDKHLEIPENFVSYLVSAEDHRFRYHLGVDQVGIIRAFYKTIVCSEKQGASTIEQQFVRVVTSDYSYTLLRKITEQLLAVLLVKRRCKFDIARAYLAIAYYGHDCEGSAGLSAMIGMDFQLASEIQIISIMAMLKYPKPSAGTDNWERRISQRVSYIRRRHEKSTAKSRHRILRTTV